MPSCLSPIFLDNKDDLFKPSLSKLYNQSNIASCVKRVVPCGNCVNCLKNKQSDFAFRIVSEAKKYGSMVFVTFTYRPDTIPFSINTYYVDKSSGDMSRVSERVILKDSPLLDYVRSEYDKSIKNRCVCKFDFVLNEDRKGEYRYLITPSISRNDFRLWLKRERVAYKRSFGVGLPDFKYCCIGEYGEHTLRPHMHCVFCGLSYQQVCRICQSWRDKYGFVYVEKVNCINLDGSSGFGRCARYVAKYLFKGKFDNPAVITGDAEKGRVCCSISLGSDLSPNVRDYLLCKDVFGEIDLNNCKHVNGNKLTDSELRSFVSIFSRRSIINLDGVYYRLPRSIIRKLFYVTVKEYNQDGKCIKFCYQPTAFQRSCSLLVQANFFNDYRRQFVENCPFDITRATSFEIRSYLAGIKTTKVLGAEAREFSFQKSLLSSKF